jgi:hypothetical protein
VCAYSSRDTHIKTKPIRSPAFLAGEMDIILAGADVILIIYTKATGESTCLCIQTDVSKFISRCSRAYTYTEYAYIRADVPAKNCSK